MKIVSWNCNGAFRKKYQKILELDADIYVIQECEPLDEIKGDLKNIISNGIWEKGANKKGVLVFSKKDILLEKQEWDNYGMRVFIPILVNNTFTLVAVWTTKPAYIEEFCIWQLVNAGRINKDVVFIGDYNSNAIWDKGHSERGHMSVVEMLKEKGLESAYHFLTGEKQGEETKPTFYMYRKIEKTFHIDHCFINSDMLQTYEVLDRSWLEISDHIPVVLEIKKGEREDKTDNYSELQTVSARCSDCHQ